MLSCFQPPSGHGDAGCRWDLTSLFSTFTHSDRMVVGKSEHLEPASMGDSYLKTLCKDCRQCFYWHHGHPLTYSFSAISLIAECETAHVHIGKNLLNPVFRESIQCVAGLALFSLLHTVKTVFLSLSNCPISEHICPRISSFSISDFIFWSVSTDWFCSAMTRAFALHLLFQAWLSCPVSHLAGCLWNNTQVKWSKKSKKS